MPLSPIDANSTKEHEQQKMIQEISFVDFVTDFDQAVESRQANSATPEQVGNILKIDLPSSDDGKSAKPTPHFED